MNNLFVFLAGLIFSFQQVIAHELPLNIVHPNKSVAVATSFTLTGSEIQLSYSGGSQYFDFASWVADKSASNSERRQADDDCAKITNARTCGQVDQFFMAATVAMHTCNSFAVIQKANYTGGLVPRFTAPSSFVSGINAAVGHHENYDLSQGISFDCVYPIERSADNTEIR